MNDPAEEFIIPCANHPAERATHNCMNCGKPLCMICVNERGYYCSPACKSTVQATEPSAPRNPDLDKVEAQVERSLHRAASLFGKLVKLAALLLILGAGYYAYRLAFGPKGQVSQQISFNAEMGRFRAEIAGPQSLIIQANSELFRLNFATQQKEWSLDLAPLGEYIRFTGLTGDRVLVESETERFAFDAQTGQQLWRVTASTGELWGERLVSFQQPQPAADDDEEEGEITAGDPEMFRAQRLLGLAKGEEPAPANAEYLIRFTGLRDAVPVQEVKLTLSGSPEIHVFGDWLVVIGGRHLAVFDAGLQLVWQVALDAEIGQVSRGERLVAVATKRGVVALDAQTGKQRWTRAELAADQLAVGPDDAIYAQVRFPADSAKSQTAKFRAATVALSGSSNPLGPVVALLQLDPRDGQTRWGVRNIGEHILFAGNQLVVADATEQMDLLASAGLFQGYYSVRQLNPRNGADVWSYVTKGQLFDARLLAGKPFLIAATDPPAGRRNPTCNYLLQVVEGR